MTAYAAFPLPNTLDLQKYVSYKLECCTTHARTTQMGFTMANSLTILRSQCDKARANRAESDNSLE